VDEQRSVLLGWKTAVADAVAAGWTKEETQTRVKFPDLGPVDIGQEYMLEYVETLNAGSLFEKLTSRQVAPQRRVHEPSLRSVIRRPIREALSDASAPPTCRSAEWSRQQRHWSEDRSWCRGPSSVERFPNGKVLSSPLRPCKGNGPAAFPLVRGYVVGATGFEPVTSSVSANHQGTAVRTTVSPGRVRPSGLK
jgi:hypothetical protein